MSVVVGRGGLIRTEKEKNYLNFAADKLLAENPQPVILLTLCVATFPFRNRKSFCPREVFHRRYDTRSSCVIIIIITIIIILIIFTGEKRR
jgi:hypothetical protein